MYLPNPPPNESCGKTGIPASPKAEQRDRSWSRSRSLHHALRNSLLTTLPLFRGAGLDLCLGKEGLPGMIF